MSLTFSEFTNDEFDRVYRNSLLELEENCDISGKTRSLYKHFQTLYHIQKKRIININSCTLNNFVLLFIDYSYAVIFEY